MKLELFYLPRVAESILLDNFVYMSEVLLFYQIDPTTLGKITRIFFNYSILIRIMHLKNDL